MATRLTESQLARWRRTRAKGRPRVLLEQLLVWTLGVGMGGPTFRAFMRGGSAGAWAYWSGEAAPLHIALALIFGAVMTYVFGVVAWNRMERLFAEAAAEDP